MLTVELRAYCALARSSRPAFPPSSASTNPRRPQFPQTVPSPALASDSNATSSRSHWGDGSISRSGAEAYNSVAATAAATGSLVPCVGKAARQRGRALAPPPASAAAATVAPAPVTARAASAAGSYTEAALDAAGEGRVEMYPTPLPGAAEQIREVYLSSPDGRRIKQQVHAQEYAQTPSNTVRYTLAGNRILPSGVVMRPTDGGYDDDKMKSKERLDPHQRDESDLCEVMQTAAQVEEDLMELAKAEKHAAVAAAAGATGGDGSSSGLGPRHSVPPMALLPSPASAAPVRDKGKLPASCHSHITAAAQPQHIPGREAELGGQPPGPAGMPPVVGQDGAGPAISQPRAPRLSVPAGYTPLVRSPAGTGVAIAGMVVGVDVDVASRSGRSSGMSGSDGQRLHGPPAGQDECRQLNLRGAAPDGGGGGASQMLSKSNLQQLLQAPVRTGIWAVYNEMMTATLPIGVVKAEDAVQAKTALRYTSPEIQIALADSDASGGRGSESTGLSSEGTIPVANIAVAVVGVQAARSTSTALIPPKRVAADHRPTQSRDSEVIDVLLTQRRRVPGKDLYAFMPTDVSRPADIEVDPHYVNMEWYQGEMGEEGRPGILGC